MPLGRVNCSYRRTEFLKDKRHIKENIKLGHKLVEFFGLAGEHKRYDQLKKIKQKLAKKYKLNLLAIYPQDLFSNNLAKVMKI